MSGLAACDSTRRQPRRQWRAVILLPACLITLSLTVGLLLQPLPASAQAADPNLAVAIAKKLELLQRFLGSNSAAKIAASENAAAKELLTRANERGEKALQSYNRGDMSIAEKRLTEAYRAYSEALDMQRAKHTGYGEIKKQNAGLREEVASYLQAFDKALLAKGPAGSGLLNRSRVNELLEQSTYLEENGDPQTAQTQLKEAYNMAVAALTRIRENETVVYSLDFRTPADEYRYEQNRHQSYSMLVDQMSQSSELSAQALKLAQRYASEGAKLRQKAETQATSGQFEAAITTMEEANKRLVRSLQMMGLSIPG